MRTRLSVFLIVIFFVNVNAQGTIDDYLKSNAVDTLFANKVFNSPVRFNWTPENSLWYVNNSRKGKEYIVVSYKERKQKTAFDHLRMADALSKLLRKDILPEDLNLEDLKFNDDQSILNFSVGTINISSNLDTYELEILDTKKNEHTKPNYYQPNLQIERNRDSIESPKKDNLAYIKNNNLYLLEKETNKEVQLSFDGNDGFYYSSTFYWSPDGKKIIANKVRLGQDHKVFFVESSPSDQLQPKLLNHNYIKPGDELPFLSPQLFKIDTKKKIEIPTSYFNSQYSLSNFHWKNDSSAFVFEYNQRGHQLYRVISIDGESGNIKVVIEEKSPTFIDYSGKKFRYDITDRNEIIWASERSGWNHLYLFDGRTGEIKNQITTGKWPVREVIKIDEENREIYFTASGIDKDQDPYFIHYFKIDFDGKNLNRLTRENGNHKITFSSDYKYYVDQYSRVDMPPTSLLKSTESGKVIMELQRSDYSDLIATGWKAPEPFKVKGRDGKTDIWGVILRPTTFDPNKYYPIIEYIYAGPHDSFVPKDFDTFYAGMSSLAELGFIVVKIDGMGTSNRSKAFQDVAWKNLKDAGFPDRKLWIKAAAAEYPYMNIGKVGIHGRSAGGQSSSGALIFHSDFYDVAVSSSGCHDNRMDKIWWNEQWMGYPVGLEYSESSNVVNAALLKGNLMLIVGELDRNVDPASTFQFADALIKSNKDFELIVRPGVGHSAGNDEYDIHKRKDFFVKHLMGVAPPKWDIINKKKE